MTNKKEDGPFTVLMLDDDNEYAKSFANIAKKHRIIVKIFASVEKGFEELRRQSKKYQAVVLDGKFLLKKGQIKGEETGSAVHKAIRELDRLKSEGHVYPYCILTGFLKELEDTLSEHKCIDKGGQSAENDVCEYLLTEIKKRPETAIRQAHPEIFRFADAHLDNEDVGNLLDLLRADSLNDVRSMKKKLAFARPLLEAIYHKIGEILLGIDPLELDESDQPANGPKLGPTKIIMNRCKKELNPPNYIHYFAMNIYSLTSNEVLHKKSKKSINSEHKITEYTVQAVINSLLDIMMWASKKVKEKQPFKSTCKP